MEDAWWSDLARDIETVTATGWGVHEQAAQQWAYSTPGFVPPRIDAEFPADGLVLCFAGTTLHLEDVVSSEDRVVLVADQLQTLVMEEMGRGWPEHHCQQEFLGRLVPGVSGDQVVWLLDDWPVYRLGTL